MFIHEKGVSQTELRVAELAQSCPVSGNDGIGQMEYFRFLKSRDTGFWDSVKGKKTLDVCSGLSTLTAQMLLRGADAYALDFGYSNIQQLLKRFPRHLVSPLFLKSMEESPERYIQGSALSLPFLSETFDAVTSFYGIFGVLDNDLDLAENAINEALRVLKPGGFLSIGPMMDGYIAKKEAVVQNELLSELGKRIDIGLNVQYPQKRNLFQPLNTYYMGKLTLFKPQA